MTDSNTLLLERWQLTEQELTVIVDENPSLRGMMIGYIAEYKLRALLMADKNVTSLHKPDDHDRQKGNKNDIILVYKGHSFTFEVKSLQTNSIKYHPLDDTFTGSVQVDASDRRTVTLPDGSKLETTCLLAGGFDVVAFNLFQFHEKWNFAFALNRDLPRSTHKKYTEYQRQHLLATSVKVTWPIDKPLVANPFDLLDILIEEKE